MSPEQEYNLEVPQDARRLLALAIIMALLRYSGTTQRESLARSALQCSLFPFGTGGIIGFMISGSNLTIPAHYLLDRRGRIRYSGLGFNLKDVAAVSREGETLLAESVDAADIPPSKTRAGEGPYSETRQ